MFLFLGLTWIDFNFTIDKTPPLFGIRLINFIILFDQSIVTFLYNHKGLSVWYKNLRSPRSYARNSNNFHIFIDLNINWCRIDLTAFSLAGRLASHKFYNMLESCISASIELNCTKLYLRYFFYFKYECIKLFLYMIF